MPRATTLLVAERFHVGDVLRSRGGALVAPKLATVPRLLQALPDVPTYFVLCTQDRLFPADFLRSGCQAASGPQQ